MCDAFCLKQEVYHDGRGFLVVDAQMESPDQDCLQAYHSVTYPGQARDLSQWHLHRYQRDRFSVLRGSVAFAVSDGTSTQVTVISSMDPYTLIVPAGVYHCLRCVGPEQAMILNLPDKLYDPKDEWRIPFNEVEAVAPW
jgi:dTDP-4-dehydrorhamnose 3,5-epimerase-like enzyme